MKIEDRKTIFAGDSSLQGIFGDNSKKKSNTIFGGNLKENLDPIQQKRQEAQKRALKVVGDAFDGEKKIDDDLQGRRDHVSELRDTIKTNNKELQQIEEEKEALRESYGEDAENNPEYRARVLEKDKYAATLEEDNSTAEKQMAEETAIIKGVNKERLKSSPMVDAVKESDAIKAASSEEIKGMLVDDMKEHLDEVRKEQEEEAKKKAEEENTEEEHLAEIKEKQEQMEELADAKKTTEQKSQDDTVAITTDNMLELDKIKSDVQTEVSDIADKMKLVVEDLKGAVVDSKI